MNTTDKVSEQLQVLTRRVTELEKSNKTILKSLNDRERSQKLVDKKWTDFRKTLESMKEQSDTSDKEVRSLKENLHRLNGRIEDLFQSVQDLKHGHKEKAEGTSDQAKVIPHSHNGPKITIRKLHSVGDDKSVPSTKAPSMGRPRKMEALSPKTDQVSVPAKHKLESKITENKEKGINETPKLPIKVNHLGLRGRTISQEVDNRVRLMQGKSVEKGQATNQMANTSSGSVEEKREKMNLPTRDELKKITKARQTQRTGERPKRTVQHATGTRNEYKNLAGLSKDPEAVPDIREMSAWKTMAEAERVRGLSLTTIKRGKGPDTCLLLDISGSMEGANFEEMINTAKTFVKGIAEVAKTLEIQENIGISTFGEQTRVVQHMTNDYSRVLEALDLLSPGGPSPMSAGLYMALACCLGHNPHTTINDIPVAGRIVLITDGKGTPDIIASGEDDFPTNKETTIMKHLWLNETVEDLEKRKHRVYCVALKKTETAMMEQICKKTHGKIYKAEEIDKLVRMTQNTLQAIILMKKGLDFENADLSWMELLGLSDNPLLAGLGLGNDFEEVVHLGKYFSSLQGDSDEKVHRELKESDLPSVGARVRRGPDWNWGNQDENGPGTVIGHDGETNVWIEWDCGHRNTYGCHPLCGYDILVVDEPRILKEEMIAVGCLVERGEHWRYDDQDGGKGNVGVVINVKENGLITVRWPNRDKARYKFGFDGFFELKICDPKNVYGSVGKLKTHVWGSGSALGGETEPPSEGATASDISIPIDPTEKGTIESKEGNRIKDKEKEVNKTMTVDELNRRNNQMSIKIEGALASASEKKSPVSDIQWKYLKDDLWCEFSQDNNRKIEKAYGRNKQGSTILDLEEHVWKVSFSEMKMKCEKTHTAMAVQRDEIRK